MIAHHVVAAALAIGLAAPAAYVALDRSPCTVVKSVELLTPAVYPGGRLRWSIVVDRHAMCEYHRTAYLKDGAKTIINYDPVDLGASGNVENNASLVLEETIPERATPGPAEYFRWGHYRKSVVNDWWPLPPVLVADLKFTILEPKEHGD